MSRLAVVQMTSSDQVKHNLSALDAYFLRAKNAGVELLLLPENFAFMGVHEHDKLVIAENVGSGDIQQMVADFAKHYGIWVVAGTLPIKASKSRVRASCFVYDAAGKAVARYDKIHLFDVQVNNGEAHRESSSIEPGRDVVVVDTPVGCLGLSVCYDLRFPELFRALILKGAELFAVPAAFTATTGVAHWEVLLRARAIENLSYVLAANQCGQHASGRYTYGHSMIIDPWGKILVEQQSGEGIVSADIDLSLLHQLRRQFPCNEHHVLNTVMDKIS